MQKLAIAFLFDDTLDSDAGVAQYVKTLGSWLDSCGHRVIYIVGETSLQKWSNGKIYSLAKNFPVSFNGNRLSIPLPASSKAVKKLLAKNHFDVMHVQVPYSPFMSGRVIRKAPAKTAVVGTFHILPAGRLASLGSRFLKIIYFGGLHRFNTMVSVSAPAATFAKQYYGLHSQVIPNVIDITKFKRVKKNNNPGLVVFLGRLVQRKGCQELLEAFTHVHKWVPSARLIIAGDGPQRSQLEKYVKKNGLEGSVEFKGYISEEKKADLLASAQIACFPALYGESFGIVLLEAMASGAGVVIGGNNPGYRSVLNEQPELLFEPENTMAFARKLELFLNDAGLRRKLHTWQALHVHKYDVRKVGPEIVDAYRQAITIAQKSDKISTNEA